MFTIGSRVLVAGEPATVRYLGDIDGQASLPKPKLLEVSYRQILDTLLPLNLKNFPLQSLPPVRFCSSRTANGRASSGTTPPAASTMAARAAASTLRWPPVTRRAGPLSALQNWTRE